MKRKKKNLLVPSNRVITKRKRSKARKHITYENIMEILEIMEIPET